MKLTKITAYFNLFIGSSMILMWVFFIVMDMVPEFETAPYEIATHLVAEHLTALVLILSGVLLLKEHKLSKPSYYIGYGLLTYAVINSMGYFFSPFDLTMTIFFSFIVIMSNVLMFLNVKEEV